MRVIFDVLASPRESGGMRLHAREVILNWVESFPEDDLFVIGPNWIREDLPQRVGLRTFVWPNENFIFRIIGEMLVVPFATRILRGGGFLWSLSPVLSPLLPKSRCHSVSHDWRHLANPDEFSRMQRLYRRIWKGSLSRAESVVAVSEKTAQEIAVIRPETVVHVIPNGRDHARRWELDLPPSDDDVPTLVTFGHKNHKRPELAIEALAILRDLDRTYRLFILGAEGQYRDGLSALARQIGVEDTCIFPGFVDDSTYHTLIRSASAVLLLSTDEGFGLPVAEAEYFGIPAIVAEDSGIAPLHPHALATSPTAVGVAEAIVHASDLDTSPASNWSWRDVVGHMRAIHKDTELNAREPSRSVLLVSADRTSPLGHCYSLGDAMLTDALAAELRRGGADVTVVDFGSIDRFDGSRKHLDGLGSLLKEARHSSRIILGGGTLLQDDVPDKFLGGLPRLCLATSLIGILTHKRVDYVAVGMDPVDRWQQRLCLWIATRLANQVLARDRQSRERVESHLRRSAELSGDASTLLDRRSIGRPLLAERKGVILALNGVDAPSLSRETVDSLAETYGSVSFLSMHQGPIPDAHYLQSSAREAIHVIPGELHWTEALSLVAQSAVLIGSRMHALYLAAFAGTPAIAIGTSAKVLSFAQDFRVPLIRLGDLPLPDPAIPSPDEVSDAEARLRKALNRSDLNVPLGAP